MSLEEIIAQTPDYEVTKSSIGEYLLVRLRGRFSEDLLYTLRNRIFRARCSFAIDASGMEGLTTPFAREIMHTADLLKGTNQRVVLVNPPAALRSLLTLVSTSHSIAVVSSEDDLADDSRGGAPRARHESHELEKIQKEFKTNRLWQLVNREGFWLCPFCGEVQRDVPVPSALSLAPAAVEKVYRHLWNKCLRFSASSPAPRPLSELEAALKRANKDTIVLSKQRVSALEKKAAAADAYHDSVRMASERQRRLLPPAPPQVQGAEIDIVYRPAEQVGGDFYDFIPLRDGRLGFLIGDVSGHGIEAGILMGMAKKVIGIRLEETADPLLALLLANRDLFRELDRVSFVTAFAGVYDPGRASLVTARAGHNPPIVYNKARTPAHLQIQPAGKGLGLTREDDFNRAMEQQTVAIVPGDALLLYTDGLVEAHSPEQKEFGMERLLLALESTAGKKPSTVLNALSMELDQFIAGGPPEDDVTAVCIRFS